MTARRKLNSQELKMAIYPNGYDGNQINECVHRGSRVGQIGSG